MTWSVRSDSRWLECSAGLEFTADPETSSILGDLPSYSFMITPTGPAINGVTSPSELYAAAVHLIPDGVHSGKLPAFPYIGPRSPRIVH